MEPDRRDFERRPTEAELMRETNPEIGMLGLGDRRAWLFWVPVLLLMSLAGNLMQRCGPTDQEKDAARMGRDATAVRKH